MTCICTGIDVNINGLWYSADVHVASKDDGVYIFRIINRPKEEPYYERLVDDINTTYCSAWFGQRDVTSTLVVPRDAVRLNDAAADYLEKNLEALS